VREEEHVWSKPVWAERSEITEYYVLDSLLRDVLIHFFLELSQKLQYLLAVSVLAHILALFTSQDNPTLPIKI